MLVLIDFTRFFVAFVEGQSFGIPDYAILVASYLLHIHFKLSEST